MAKRLSYKAIVFLFLLFQFPLLRGQVLILPELQTHGVIMKQQVWSLLINNMSGQLIKANLSVSITNRVNSQPLLQANSGTLLLNSGIKRIVYNDLVPLNYSLAAAGFGMDRQLNQPFPVGEYLVCYALTDADNKNLILARECLKIIAEPLSPPQLIQPGDGAMLTSPRPVLTWVPPAPLYMFNSLSYDIIVSPIYEQQSPEEAIQRNIPVMSFSSAHNSLLYPPSFTDLQPGKTYAWQVVAKDAANYGGKSEAWTFTILPDSVKKIISSSPYIKLGTQKIEVTVMHQGFLKMEYFNALPDTIVNVEVFNMNPVRKHGPLFSFRIAVQPGQNFLEHAVKKSTRLDESQTYELRIINSKKETWYMRFTPKYYF